MVFPSDEDLERLKRRFTPPATVLASATSTWLAARKQPASPRLAQAWSTIMAARMLSPTNEQGVQDNDSADLAFEIIQELIERAEESAELRQPVRQALDHLNTDPLMMQNAILKYGLADSTAKTSS